MGLSTSGRTWEDASSPAAVRLARRFEVAWRDSNKDGRRPDPDDFLPDDPEGCPGVRLALLRADLALRREAGEDVDAEWYRDRYRDLGAETLVALAYEEFCLREEDGEVPDPAEYLARFPSLAPQLRRVFDIHGLVGSAPTTVSHAPASPEIPFPAAGQTIAGFHLVEELGRGAFARVFRAEERQLADRPVALKVARAGSREPQTLARLQHTHIVPVHSSRADPATGLHLLCMPYFGRITLARLLADPKVKVARSGAELVAALDRLEPPEGPRLGRLAGRAALARRSYAQAIAWWGARMAEALEHAHDRGVLHRDIKSSNVLVTGDGMPMLLDFNLARESVIADPEAAPDRLGGTLDYMAPEHLEALADGLADRVDARSDLYGLGVVLYEALMGERPFPPPARARSAAEILLRAADDRRAGAPSLRDTHPEVPAALEAVVRLCLAPDPDDRYASAGELAHDLQAVADDLPLRYAREPLPSRAGRWLRRNRRALATVAPILLALVVVAVMAVKANLERRELELDVRKLIEGGRQAVDNEDFPAAVTKFEAATILAKDRADLLLLFKEAREEANLAKHKGETRGKADAFFKGSRPLRFRLAGILGDPKTASRQVEELLNGTFYVLGKEPLTSRAEMVLLDEARRGRLVKEVNELLFLWAVAGARSGDREAIRAALATCDRALTFAVPKGPWTALRALLEAQLGESAASVAAPASGDNPSAEASALVCFQWGYLRQLEGRYDRAFAWFRRAVQLTPDDDWYAYYLAYAAHLLVRRPQQEALGYYHAAVALDPTSPWVRFGRGRLYREVRALSLALDDLQVAMKGFEREPEKPEMPEARLELGLVRQSLGDPDGARAEYREVIRRNAGDRLGRAARLNLAALDVDSGAVERARTEFDALLSEDPGDVFARLGRAQLALRQGRVGSAETDLDVLVRQTDGHDDHIRAQVFANRAKVLFLRGRVAEAESDAANAMRVDPNLGYERLRARIVLALGRVQDLAIDRPEEFARLPMGGNTLARDLRAAADRLDPEAIGRGPVAFRALLVRAVLLAALGDPGADREADRAVALAPLSPQAYLIRARVRRHRGARADALEDVRQGLELQADDPKLWELRGILDLESRDPRAALAALDRAIRLGAGDSAWGPKAAASLALGDAQGAYRNWTIVLNRDPEDPRAFLGRARALGRLKEWDRALADLEQAAAWSVGQPGLALPIALAAARSLADRPDQLPRVLRLARRARENAGGGRIKVNR